MSPWGFFGCRISEPSCGLIPWKTTGGSRNSLLFHSSVWVNLKLHRLNRTSKTLVIFSRVFVIGIVFWVIDMLLGSIDAKSLFSHFKFLSGVAKRQEAQDPDLIHVRRIQCSMRAWYDWLEFGLLGPKHLSSCQHQQLVNNHEASCQSKHAWPSSKSICDP